MVLQCTPLEGLSVRHAEVFAKRSGHRWWWHDVDLEGSRLAPKVSEVWAQCRFQRLSLYNVINVLLQKAADYCDVALEHNGVDDVALEHESDILRDIVPSPGHLSPWSVLR